MYYVKLETPETLIRLELNEGNVFNPCPDCGQDVHVDFSDIVDGTAVFCQACTAARRERHSQKLPTEANLLPRT